MPSVCMRVQFQTLDMAYIEHWARQLGVELLWHRLIAEAEPTE